MTKKAKILVVDDDSSLKDTLSKVLQKEGYETGTASSAEEALELLKKESFDLTITDLYMPYLKGIELMEEIKKIVPIPVIIMTAFGDWGTYNDAMKKGAFDFGLDQMWKAPFLLRFFGVKFAVALPTPRSLIIV